MFENLSKHLGSLSWNYHYLRRCWWHFLSFNRRNGRKWYIQEFLSAAPLPCHYRHFTIVYKSIWDAAKLLETTTLIFFYLISPQLKGLSRARTNDQVCVWSAGKLHYKSWNNCDTFLVVVMLDTWIFLILNIIIKVWI